MKLFLLSAFIGLAAGCFGGLLGVGGGIVMIPLLVGVAKLRQRDAHGTSLCALVFTGVLGAALYARNGAVDVAAAVSLALPAMVTARMGARFAHSLPDWKLKRSFGAFLLFITAVLLLKPILGSGASQAVGVSKVLLLSVTGALTGFLAGMMGVGGGSLMVPAMVILTGFPQVVAQGSSLLAMVPAGISGAHQHWQLGNISKKTMPGLVVGILAGTWMGSSLALRLQEATLRFGFSALVLYTGVRYLTTPKPEAVPEIGSASERTAY